MKSMHGCSLLFGLLVAILSFPACSEAKKRGKPSPFRTAAPRSIILPPTFPHSPIITTSYYPIPGGSNNPFKVQSTCPTFTLSGAVVESIVTASQIVHVKATISGSNGSSSSKKKNKKNAANGADTISLAIVYDDNVLYFPQPSVKPSLPKSYPKPIFYDPFGDISYEPTSGTMYWKSIPLPAKGRTTTASVVGMVEKDVADDALVFEIIAFKGTLDAQTCVVSKTLEVSYICMYACIHASAMVIYAHVLTHVILPFKKRPFAVTGQA